MVELGTSVVLLVLFQVSIAGQPEGVETARVQIRVMDFIIQQIVIFEK